LEFIPLIKERVQEFKIQGAMLQTNAYSRGIKALKFFAPAKPHKIALLLMIEAIIVGMDATLQITLAFLSFQISQAVSKSNEERPFRRLPLTPEIWHHHSSRES
jgi:hypothetical protein